ncbi:MAG: hypothetical protein WA892_10255 [Ornithinimicrobium sp.]
MSEPDGAQLRFAEVETLQDLSTYVARARTLDAEGAIRLQARGEVLAAWVRVLPGQGLLGSGLVLGLRVMKLDGTHDVDATVPLAAVSDRLARRVSTGDVSAVLQLPPMRVTPSWAAISPPRGGWEPRGQVAHDVLVQAARDGIEAVAQGTPHGAGAAAVASLRERIWGQRLSEDEGAPPAGAAMAAHTLGFTVPDHQGTVLTSGPWTRLSLRNGDVLAR